MRILGIRLVYLVSFGVILGALVFFAMLFVWSTKPYDPLTFKKEPIPVFQKSVEVGQPIVIQFDYCKNVEGPEEVETKLVGRDIIYDLPVQNGNAPEGCGFVNAVIIIPLEATPGEYHVEYTATYQVNPIRRIVEEFQTVPFMILPPAGTIIEVVPPHENEPVEIQLEGAGTQDNK